MPVSSRPEPIRLPAGTPKATTRPYFARASGRAFHARMENGATIIDLMDEIGAFGITDKEFQAKLSDVDGDVTVKINSPGGDIFQGLAMFNALASHPGYVRIEILGVAASSASVVAMAGDSISIAENSFLMIHRAWGMTVGNEQDHSEAVSLLRAVDGSMAATYAKRSGQPLATVQAAMNAETWFDAESAVAAGYADDILEPAPIRARFDLSVYAKAPAALTADIDRGNPTIRDLESALRDAGYSRSQAKALAARGFTGDADEQREAAEIAELAAHIRAAAQSIQI